MPEYAVNDFGTNNTIAGAASPPAAMVIGALVWCAGQRWGAGLAGGAGASLAGWAALVLGAAEWRLDLAAPDADATRVDRLLGPRRGRRRSACVALIGSFAASGRDRRNGLDPWIAALAAVSFVIAAGGPLIPEGARRLGQQLDRRQPGRPADDVLRRARRAARAARRLRRRSAACSCAAGASASPSAAR